MHIHPTAHLGLALVFGLGAGFLFFRPWRRFQSGSRGVWLSIPASVRGMMASEDSAELFRHYRALISVMGRYAAMNLLGVLLGILPASALYLVLDVLDPAPRAAAIEVYPAARAAPLAKNDARFRVEAGRVFIDRNQVGNASIAVAGRSLTPADLARKQALCDSGLTCLFFDMLLFETHRAGEPGSGSTRGTIILRPALLDANPAWPYLNDSELLFFIAILAGSVAEAWLRSRRVRQASAAS